MYQIGERVCSRFRRSPADVLCAEQAAPAKDRVVGGDERSTERDRGCHDDSIGRIGMQIAKLDGCDADGAAHPDLTEPLFEDSRVEMRLERA